MSTAVAGVLVYTEALTRWVTSRVRIPHLRTLLPLTAASWSTPERERWEPARQAPEGVGPATAREPRARQPEARSCPRPPGTGSLLQGRPRWRRGHSSDSPAGSCCCSSLYRPAQMSCFLEPEVGTRHQQNDEDSLCCDPCVITAAGTEPALSKVDPNMKTSPTEGCPQCSGNN